MERFLNSEEVIREVDLSFTETEEKELLNLRGKSRKEILEIYANLNSVERHHEKLVNALKRNDIDHIVITFTNNIYLKDSDWNTLVQISFLVNELQCDLTVSGGTICKYSMNVHKALFNHFSKCYTDEYQNKIASSCSSYNKQPVRSVKVGVMDSGCSLTLYRVC